MPFIWCHLQVMVKGKAIVCPGLQDDIGRAQPVPALSLGKTISRVKGQEDQ
jgi:hypothetical protein